MPWILLDVPDEVLADLPQAGRWLVDDPRAQAWIEEGVRVLGIVHRETLDADPAGVITSENLEAQHHGTDAAREAYLAALEQDLSTLRAAYPEYKADGDAMESYMAACHAYARRVREALAPNASEGGGPS